MKLPLKQISMKFFLFFFFFAFCHHSKQHNLQIWGKMDYDDEDDQYRQYEDEMYKDASEEG